MLPARAPHQAQLGVLQGTARSIAGLQLASWLPVRRENLSPLALWQKLEAVAAAAGIDAMGVASAEPLSRAAEVIEQAKSRGLHAGMYFTFSNPRAATTPELIVPGARSVVVGALSYRDVAAGPSTSESGAGKHGASESSASESSASESSASESSASTAAIANYVVEDQYGPLAAALELVAEQLRQVGEQASVVLDDNRLVDRAVAYQAGLGWFGRNTMLLHPVLGSWTVLGAVVTTAELPTAEHLVSDGCGSCQRCVQACPTGALSSGPDDRAELDANRCLAWLLQADGVFPREHRVALGDRLYGCDDCQTVCPYNDLETSPTTATATTISTTNSDLAVADTSVAVADPMAEDIASWASRRGQNHLNVRGKHHVNPAKLLLQSDEELMAGFGHWYIPRRRPEYLRRNALLVLANTADPTSADTIAALQASLCNQSAIVRSHAVWSAARLGHDQLIDKALLEGELLADDPAGIVADELAADELAADELAAKF